MPINRLHRGGLSLASHILGQRFLEHHDFLLPVGREFVEQFDDRADHDDGRGG